MDDPRLYAAICAMCTGTIMVYAGWLARERGRANLATFRWISAAWFCRYGLSLLAVATGTDALQWASEPWVIFVSNAGMATGALLSITDWRATPRRGES